MSDSKVYLLTGTIYDSMCDSTYGIAEHIFGTLADANKYVREHWLDVDGHNVLSIEHIANNANRFMVSIPSDDPELVERNTAVLVLSERTVE